MKPAKGHLYTMNMVSGRVSCVCGWHETVKLSGLETVDGYRERCLAAYRGHM